MRLGVDRVFLDANLLFSAAYKPDSHLLDLWALPDTEVVTSELAFEEARRNLAARGPDRVGALDELRARTRVTGDTRIPSHLLEDVALPDKDRPILAAALAVGCTHLLTGDRRHFGALCGRTIAGVLVLTPAEYFRRRRSAGRRRRA